MLTDREYMREPDYRHRWSATTWVSILLVAAFVLQTLATFWMPESAYVRVLNQVALSRGGLFQGKLWQLITYQFLHAGVLHLLGNLIALWCFGQFVERTAGRARFYLAWLGGGIAGGLLQMLLAIGAPKYFDGVVGASAGVCAVLAIFCLMRPNDEIQLYAIIPVRAKWFLWGLTAVSLLFVVAPVEGQRVAHAAHLGGIFWGWLFVSMRWYDTDLPLPWQSWFERWRGTPEKSDPTSPAPRRRFRVLRGERADPPGQVPPTGADYIAREVDPILDKIATHGIHSLTAEERRILEAARSRMGRR